MKDVINIAISLPRSGSVISLCSSWFSFVLKSDNFLHKWGFIDSQLLPTVPSHDSSSGRGHKTSGIAPSGPNYWVASGATLASRPKKSKPGDRSRHAVPPRAPSVENMLDESSLDTNSTSIPSYCTVDRRTRNLQPPNSVGTSRHQQPHFRPKSRAIPISSDESSDNGRPLSVPPNRRIYKVNSFQRPPANMSMV